MANVNHVDLIHFINGVSESISANALFSNISHYVHAMEILNNIKHI